METLPRKQEQLTQMKVGCRKKCRKQWQYYKQLIQAINNKSMLKQEGNRFQNWLAYTPLLYNQLFIFAVPEIKQINSIRWQRGLPLMKSSFKFQEAQICVVGATAKASKSNNLQGLFALYKVLLPAPDQLDDDRLNFTAKSKSVWRFQQQIQLMQQLCGEGYSDSNLFAFSYKKQPKLFLIPTSKLITEGAHPEYAETLGVKLQGHKLPLTCMKWANFGTSHKILTSSLDSTIIQWDVQKKVLERQLMYHKSSVQSLTPLFDYQLGQGNSNNVMENFASVSSDGTLLIWDRKSPNPVIKLSPGQKQLSAIDCVSKNILVTGGEEGSVKMLDLRYNRQYLYDSKNDKVSGHSGRIKSIKVVRTPHTSEAKSGDPRISDKIKFVTSSNDGKIIEWQQKIQFVHEGHEITPTFDLSDQHRNCASADQKKNVIMLWESGVSLSQAQY